MTWNDDKYVQKYWGKYNTGQCSTACTHFISTDRDPEETEQEINRIIARAKWSDERWEVNRAGAKEIIRIHDLARANING